MWTEHLRQGVELPNVAVFYGLEGSMLDIFRHYRDTQRAAVYVDLGYWGRREGGRFTGYHKVVVNARHPTAYFRARRAGLPSRFDRFRIQPAPARYSQGLILLAGMGDKGALAEGRAPEEFERQMIEEIRRHTARPIMYRPKPSWKTSRPIGGTIHSPRDRDIPWPQISAVVTHHSNVAVEGLLEGLPTWCWSGVAAPLAHQSLANIGVTEHGWATVPSIEERLAWCEDIAYTQWSVAEMASGACWRHLLDEELV